MDWRIGSAPDSWGVWFPQDPKQPPAERFLDEVAAAGYRWIELGPYGYLPTEVDALEAELDRRELRVAGTFVQFDLQDPAERAARQDEVEATCALLRRLDAPHLIVIDAIYTDLHTGAVLAPPELDDAAWGRLVESTERVIETADRYGLTCVFHPHAETHVEREEQVDRLLDDVPGLMLCHDVGHFAYRAGDPVAFFRRRHDRIRHLHLKSLDELTWRRAEAEGLPFSRAVADGVFVEPSRGLVDFEALRDALVETGYSGFCIVEQDMYPVDSFDDPFPIAERTFAYFQELGLA
jgi:inosose dehydratase